MGSWLRVFIVSLVFSVGISIYSHVLAQEVDTEILSGSPLIESYNLYETSSYLQNWNITKDREGNLFVGTGGNLMLYDGERWSSNSIRGTAVFSVQPGVDGNIYTGGADEIGYFKTSGSGLVDSLTYQSLSSLVPGKNAGFGRVNKIITRPDSSVYFGGSRFTLRYNDESISSLSDDIWIFRIFDAHDQVYTNDSLGVSLFDGQQLNLLPDAEQFEFTGINCVLPKEDDGLIIHVRDKGLYSFNGKNFEHLQGEASDFLQQLQPYTCLQLQDGTYFVGTTTGGGIRFDADGTLLGRFNEDTGLPENVIYDSFLDPDGTLWLSHFEHISKLDFGEPVRRVNRGGNFIGLPHSVVTLDGDLYASTDRGLFKVDMVNNDVEKLLSTSIDSRLFVHQGRLYLYTESELFRPLESSEKITETRASILRIYPYRHNPDLYFTFSNDGMTFIKKDGSGFNETDLITDVNLRHADLVENEYGDIWVGSDSGNLISVPGEEIERYLKTGQISITEYEMPEGWHRDRSTRISMLLLDGDVLIGTPTGLYKIDLETNSIVEDNRFGDLSRVNEQGNPSSIHRMVADEDGNVWIRSSREFQYAERRDDGSYQVHRNSLKRIQDDQNNDILPLRDGKVWFAGSEGLIYYDHTLSTERQVRPPIIRSVTANQDSLVFRGFDRAKAEENNLTLPYAMNDLRIEYAFTDFSSFGGTEYQVKLEGFDEDWTIWSDEPRKDYTQIREGSYRFLVRARDLNGEITEATVLPIRILPPWYRTIWAYILYLVGLSGLLYGIHKYRVNRILHVQNIRNKIASDLHDEISATLSSISYFSEAIERGSDQTKSKRYLGLISKSAHDAKEKISDIIWSINPENDDWRNLLTKCRRFASDMLESKNISYEFDIGDPPDSDLDIEVRKNLWLIFKEIITNISRHSKAEKVFVMIRFQSSRITLEIADDGIGFDAEKSFDSNGIRNIKMRADQLGLDYTLESSESGTRWVIQGRI